MRALALHFTTPVTPLDSALDIRCLAGIPSVVVRAEVRYVRPLRASDWRSSPVLRDSPESGHPIMSRGLDGTFLTSEPEYRILCDPRGYLFIGQRECRRISMTAREWRMDVPLGIARSLKNSADPGR